DGGAAVAVADEGEEAIAAGFVRKLHFGAARIAVKNRLGIRRRGDLLIPAGGVLLGFAMQLPFDSKLLWFGIEHLHRRANDRSARDLVGADDLERLDLRASVGGRAAGPQLRQRVDRRRARAVGKKHSKPGGRRLLFDAPEE